MKERNLERVFKPKPAPIQCNTKGPQNQVLWAFRCGVVLAYRISIFHSDDVPNCSINDLYSASEVMSTP